MWLGPLCVLSQRKVLLCQKELSQNTPAKGVRNAARIQPVVIASSARAAASAIGAKGASNQAIRLTRAATATIAQVAVSVSTVRRVEI